MFNHLVRPPALSISPVVHRYCRPLSKMNSLQQQSESRMYSKHIFRSDLSATGLAFGIFHLYKPTRDNLVHVLSGKVCMSTIISSVKNYKRCIIAKLKAD
jgi:hypothetical protein